MVTLHRPDTELVDLRLLAPAAGAAASAAPGWAAFACGLLDESTRRRSGTELARLAERLGAHLSSGCTWDGGSLEALCLRRHATALLEILAEAAAECVFADDDVERERRRRLAALERAKDRPAAVAYRSFLALLYRSGCYATPVAGTTEAVTAATREDLAAHWRRACGTGDLTLLMVGEVAGRGLVENGATLLERLVRAGAPGPPAPPPTAPSAGGAGPIVGVTDRPEASQSELVLGLPMPPADHGDRAALAVLNCLFGGKFSSRLNLNLRERHGWTYGVHSRLDARRGPAPLRVGCAVDTEAVAGAIGEIVEEMERLRCDPVPAAELRQAKHYLLGVFPYTLQGNSALADRLESQLLLGLPADHYRRWLERIAEVTEAEILRVARSHLDPGRVAVAVVGPAERIRPQLEAAELAQVVVPEPPAPL